MVNIPLFILFMLLIVFVGRYGLSLFRKWIKPERAPWRAIVYILSSIVVIFVFIIVMFSLFFYFNGPLKVH